MLAARSICLSLALLAGCAGPAFGGGSVSSQEIRLPSQQVKASMIAYSAWEKTISAESDGQSALSKHVSNIDNYSVFVSEDDQHYRVRFSLLPMNGEILLGGGARYTITKRDFRIVEVERFK